MRQPTLVLTLSVAASVCAVFSWAPDARGAAKEPGAMLDALRMPYSEQIQKFWDTLKRCGQENPDFQISAKVQDVGVGVRRGITCTYSVTLPDFMLAGLPGLRRSDQEPLLELLLTEALRTKEVSYYAALLAIHAGYNYICGGLRTPPLVDKDRAKWEENHAQNVELWFSRNHWWEYAKERYLRWLFLRSLSKQHQTELKVERGTLVGSDDSMSKYRRLKADIRAGKPPIGFDERFAVGDAVIAYADKADTGSLIKLPADRDTLLIWGAFLVNTDGEDLPAVVNAFLRYAEIHGLTPMYVDMALALLVVRGYEYDPANGRYTLTSVGQRLLEYAIEHPIPEVLRIGEVLKDRWSEDGLMKLIQKHHKDAATWEGFRRKVAGSQANAPGH